MTILTKRKRYKIDRSDLSNVKNISARASAPRIIRLSSSVHAIKRQLDFDPLYGKGYDEILFHMHQALWELYCSGTRSLSSIETYFSKGIEPFCNFLEVKFKCQGQGKEIGVENINILLLEDYLFYLSQTPGKNGDYLSYGTQRIRFSSIRTILIYLSRKKILPERPNLIPPSPYPNIARKSKGAKPYSERERRAIQKALRSEFRKIDAGESSLHSGQKLAVIFLLVSAATGRNTSQLLELKRDSLRPHPVKSDRWLLVSFKQRGNHKDTLSLSANSQGTSTVNGSIVHAIQCALRISAEAADKAPGPLTNRLWLFQHNGEVRSLNQQALSRHADEIRVRHELVSDDGSPLRLTVGSFRKTFIGRLWKLSGGDPLVTARLAGHSVEVSNSHYLAVTPEMEIKHKFCGIALVDYLRDENDSNAAIGSEPIYPTAVSSCSDPLSGRYAPKDGSHCMDFLSCFRCPNQVITQDDLYRMFSFYWLLIEERNLLGKMRWSKVYGHVIDDIDNVISPLFPNAAIARARELAREQPHLMWKSRLVLGSPCDGN